MRIELTCSCGTDIEASLEADGRDGLSQVTCDDCGAAYAVTVTQVRWPDELPHPPNES